LDLYAGQAYLFNAHLVHGAESNLTDNSRISFDFRIRPFGECGGMKSDEFFETPDQFDSKIYALGIKQSVGVAYVNMHEGFTRHISQKIQQLMCFQYAEEKNIFILSAETEIDTMLHYPMLFDLLEGSEARDCDVIVLFSVLLLPKDAKVRSKVFELARKRGIALAFIPEDLVFPANGSAKDEATILHVRSEMVPTAN
jgi:sporadic carbohydrate cluster protein (TIGR04323 family)